MKAIELALAAAIALSAPFASAGPLPVPGTRFQTLPAGKGKTAVEAACVRCHSADLIVQQRMTPKQWTATVEKMIRWGAKMSESSKPAALTYLSSHFGPANRSFKPIRTSGVK